MATATQTTATTATATRDTSITPSSIPSSTDIFDDVAAATVEPYGFAARYFPVHGARARPVWSLPFLSNFPSASFEP
jgi:hypothetical protein